MSCYIFSPLHYLSDVPPLFHEWSPRAPEPRDPAVWVKDERQSPLFYPGDTEGVVKACLWWYHWLCVCASVCVYLRKLLDCNLLKLTILWPRLHVFSTFSLLQHGNASTRTYIDTVTTTSAYSSIVCKYKEPQHCLSSIKFPNTDSLSASDLARRTTSKFCFVTVFSVRIYIFYIYSVYTLENCRMHEMCESYFVPI